MSTASSDVTAGTNATSGQYNNLRADLTLGKNNTNTETDGATVTIDWSVGASGKVRSVTISGNRTLAFSNPTVGQTMILRIIQNAGSNTVTWPATSKFAYGVIPTLSTAAAAIDVFGILCITAGGSPVYEVYTLGQAMA